MTALFVLGVRTSTVVALLAFVAAAIYRGEKRPLAYAWVWLAGFEAAFQTTSFVFGYLPAGPYGPLTFIAIGVPTVAWSLRRGIRPSAPLIAAAAAIWVVWVATGFHVNGHTTVDLNLTAEFLNEAAKTLWAAAYLLPLFVDRPSLVVRKDVTV